MSRERPDHTLQTGALVNEAYLKLVDQTRVRWQNRALDDASQLSAFGQTLSASMESFGRSPDGRRLALSRVSYTSGVVLVTDAR